MWPANSAPLPPPRARGRIRGFTLLELLVALAVLSLMVTGLYWSVGSSAAHGRRLGARLQRQQAARLVLRRLAEDLEGAFWLPGRDAVFFEGGPGAAAGADAARLGFTSALYPWGGRVERGAGLAAVAYFLRRAPGEEGWNLLRARRPVHGASPSEGPPSVVLEGVRAWRVEFLDAEGEAHASWSTRASGGNQGLPAAVRLTLELEEGEVFTTLIALPMGLRAPSGSGGEAPAGAAPPGSTAPPAGAGGK